MGCPRPSGPGGCSGSAGHWRPALPERWELWLDGAHNPGAGVALARHLAGWTDRPLHLVVGMKKGKDAAEFLKPLLPFAASVWAVAEPDQYLALSVPEVIAASGNVARDGGTVAEALAKLTAKEGSAPARVLVCGSLYLAGALLRRQP